MVKYSFEYSLNMAVGKDSDFVNYMLEKSKKKEPLEKSQLSIDANMDDIEKIAKDLKNKVAAVKKR